jgi:acetyl esterase/lipase
MKSFLTALALGAASVFAGEPVVHSDLAYSQPSNKSQTLDLYAPAGGTNHPVVLWIHGGGWEYGDKSNLQEGSADKTNRKSHAFTEKGFVFVAINYRLFPGATVPEMADDVAQAIRWTQQHVTEYGGDPGTIFVMGHSAGAQLAALVCTDGSYLSSHGMSLKDIKGCVPVDGDMYYPTLRIETNQNVRESKSDRLKFPDDAAQKVYSSVMHVGPGSGIPPFLILHVAGQPETGTLIQSQILRQVLREAHVPAETFACANKNHRTLNSDLGLANDKPTEAIFAFLEEQAGKPR